MIKEKEGAKRIPRLLETRQVMHQRWITNVIISGKDNIFRLIHDYVSMRLHFTLNYQTDAARHENKTLRIIFKVAHFKQ